MKESIIFCIFIIAQNLSFFCDLITISDVIWGIQQILFMSMDVSLVIFLPDEASETGTDNIKSNHEQTAIYMGPARDLVTRMIK